MGHRGRYSTLAGRYQLKWTAWPPLTDAPEAGELLKVHERPETFASKAPPLIMGRRAVTTSCQCATRSNAPVAANRVVMLLSGMFSWAMRVGKLPQVATPCTGITKYREQGKDRFLSTEELARLGETLRLAETVGFRWDIDETRPTAKHAPRPEHRFQIIEPLVTDAIRLLLFTGYRLREILGLKWDHVDLERGMRFLPDSKLARSR